jgi:uncharacterized membrane protein YphA (DoxX/SURF4 family)
MQVLQIILQVAAGLGILNVWLLRRQQATPYRGGSASNMKEEFATYGLPEWSVWVVGSLKIIFALGLLVGVFVPSLVDPSAIGLGMLMLGAFFMHLKVGDPFQRSVPALALLGVCIFIVAL